MMIIRGFLVTLATRGSAGYDATSATAPGSSVATREKNHAYRELVQRICAQGISKFPGFRTIRAYNHIVSLMSADQGRHLLETAAAVDKTLITSDTFVRAAADHARLGGGPVVPLRGIRVPTTTWRYVRVYADLRALFGLDSDFDTNVAEVGVGYGAQCDVVQRLGAMAAPFGAPAQTRRYTLCDLPEVEALAEQYIHAIRGSSATDLPALGKLNSNQISTTSCASASGDYSLFISNYAFSELTSAVQQIYWDEVIRCSRRGYVTMNSYNGMSTTDFVAKLRESGRHDATIMDSFPQAICRGRNVSTGVVVWGVNTDRVDRVEAAALSTATLKSKQATKEQTCRQMAARWCHESKTMQRRKHFAVWCDYHKTISARQWRDRDRANHHDPPPS